MVRRQILANLGRRGNPDLSIPSERAYLELLNASFIFEIGPSYLKLWLADETPHIGLVKGHQSNIFDMFLAIS